MEKEKMITLDIKYFGQAMHVGRKKINLSRRDAAHLFGIPSRQYARYERGTEIIPETMLNSIMAFAFIGMCANHAARYYQIKKGLPKN